MFPHGWNGGGESDSGAHCPPRGMVGIGGIVGTTGTYICDRSLGRIPVHLGRGLQIAKTMANVSAHPGHHGIHGGRGAFCQLERERDRDTGEGWRSAARWRVGGGASVGKVGGGGGGGGCHSVTHPSAPTSLEPMSIHEHPWARRRVAFTHNFSPHSRRRGIPAPGGGVREAPISGGGGSDSHPSSSRGSHTSHPGGGRRGAWRGTAPPATS